MMINSCWRNESAEIFSDLYIINAQLTTTMLLLYATLRGIFQREDMR